MFDDEHDEEELRAAIRKEEWLKCVYRRRGTISVALPSVDKALAAKWHGMPPTTAREKSWRPKTAF